MCGPCDLSCCPRPSRKSCGRLKGRSCYDACSRGEVPKQDCHSVEYKTIRRYRTAPFNLSLLMVNSGNVTAGTCTLQSCFPRTSIESKGKLLVVQPILEIEYLAWWTSANVEVWSDALNLMYFTGCTSDQRTMIYAGWYVFHVDAFLANHRSWNLHAMCLHALMTKVRRVQNYGCEQERRARLERGRCPGVSWAERH